MKKLILFTALAMLLWSQAIAVSYNGKTIYDNFDFTGAQIGTSPNYLHEISGLSCSRTTPGYFWVELDDPYPSGSNNRNEIYALNPNGTLKLTVKLTGLTMRDWEDIALATVGGKNYILVGAIGDNNCAYSGNYHIYIFEEPEIPSGTTATTITIPSNAITDIRFSFPDGRCHNSESLMYDPVDNLILVVDKWANRTSSANFANTVYSTPFRLTSGTVTVTAVQKLGLDNEVNTFTAADISLDGQHILIKNKKRVLYWQRAFADEPFASVIARQPELIATYVEEVQGESVGWSLDALAFYTVSDEPGPSKIFSYTRQSIPPPPMLPPFNVKAIVTGNSVSITWDAVTGAEKYSIVLFNTQTYIPLFYESSTTSIVVPNLAYGTEYSYSVCAVRGDRQTCSDDLYFTTQAGAALTVPTNVNATATEYSIFITWNPVAGASSYQIKYCRTGGSCNEYYTTTNTEILIPELLSETEYSYQVRAVRGSEQTEYSAVKYITTLNPDVAISVPANVKATATETSITVTWNPVAGATSYRVKYCYADIDYCFDHLTTTNLTMHIPDLPTGFNFSYQVCAIKGASDQSAYSAIQYIVTAAGTTPDPVPVPTNVNATATDNSITVTWNAVTGANGYQIKICHAGNCDEKYITTATSIIIPELSPETEYTYQVRTIKGSEVSEYSSVKQITTLKEVVIIPFPTNVNATATENSITVSWDAVPEADRYQVKICRTGTDSCDEIYTTGSATSLVIPNLSPATDYTYQVRTVVGSDMSEYNDSKRIATESVTETPTFASVTTVYCEGASIPALPTLSDNGITGTWEPDINNLATTIYTFTPASDENATAATLTITINNKVTPTFVSVTTAYCAGASIPALPALSDNGIIGTWSPAINNNATTTYTFAPASGECATTTMLEITINNIVTPEFIASVPVREYCEGATIPALPVVSDNGVAGTWLPAINNSATTTYTFTPTSGECVNGTTLTITINKKVTPTFEAVTTAYCTGAAIPTLPVVSKEGIAGTWSPAINNLATITYTFTPTSGECVNIATLTITISNEITPTFASVATAYCTGASIPALPAVSDEGIAGTWSPAINNFATTTYTFTPTSVECANSATLTITINNNVTPTFEVVTTEYCAGALIPALPAVSKEGIAGTWSPTINNLATTTYTFTPASGTCAIPVTLEIKINATVTPTFVSVTTEYYAGASISALPTVSDNGIAGTWSPAINNLATTIYIFTPTSGECVNSATLTITITEPVSVPMNVNATAAETSITVSWNAVQGATSYRIKICQNGNCDDSYTTTATTIVIPGLSPETAYTYQVSAIRGTEQSAYSDAKTIYTLNGQTSIAEKTAAKPYVIYIASGQLIVDNLNGATIQIYNTVGQAVVTNAVSPVNVSALKGIYIVKIGTFVKKVVFNF